LLALFAIQCLIYNQHEAVIDVHNTMGWLQYPMQQRGFGYRNLIEYVFKNNESVIKRLLKKIT